jgi:hypothetical protein
MHLARAVLASLKILFTDTATTDNSYNTKSTALTAITDSVKMVLPC